MNQDHWTTRPPAPDQAAPATPATHGAPETGAAAPLLDAKIMMVDDEPLMTDLIQAHLEEQGYANFVVANDPREALALLHRESPGLLLLDLMMPQLSGFDLLAAIRADQVLRYLPVIVLTAATGAEAKLQALQLGATDFLAKPVDPSELVLRVRNTLAFRQYHERMINFDAVTGLPNERQFERGISEMLRERERTGALIALFSIAVPESRALRESVGDAAADALARELARRLERFARRESPDDDTTTPAERAPRVGRMSAAHYALVLEGLAHPEGVEAVARRLIAVLSEPVALGPHEVAPSPWIGIAVSHDPGATGVCVAPTVESLRQGAELAATEARRRGTVQFQFSSPALNARSYERVTLGSQLRGAARRGELRLHYQPKVAIADNRIVGGEALVRWEHPDLGLLPPARFIGLAEELGIIGSIGEWVLQRVCEDAAAWAAAGLGRPRLAINVAKPQFTSGDLAGALRAATGARGVAPDQLVIELTESMLMEDAQASLALMKRIRDLGAKLSIDDFGTGYSSLSYLKRFPVDELKVDRTFVEDLPGGPADAAIVRSVIELGHNLRMSVTAEGVETDAQLAYLRTFNCDAYQGFLFSRPIPALQFSALLGDTARSTLADPATGTRGR
jgi:EAL domain-containing protein (putative c-di-GMP-specific phosphodiesterase class I)/DNA-binding response OmpR family regulator